MTPSEQVKARLDVVTLIQGYLKLEKAGVNFKTRCPFHSEKTPSFFVSPGRDMWHCFGCSKGGDIFKFVMEMEGMEFPEALRMLAERAGVEIRAESYEVRSGRAKLFTLLEDATVFYQARLFEEKEVRAYLGRRGVSSDTTKEFRIGFAPEGWRVLGGFLKRKGYTENEIEAAGLAITGSRGPYDRFRSRIIFPLEDAQGRVVGFGGRIFPPEAKENEGAKYINTPQTALYDKSRYLFALSKAKSEIRRENKAVVVEGYLDAILSHQVGVKNTVAVSGTALTDMHLGMLRRIADSLVFAFDADSAGIEATRRAVNLAYPLDFSVKIVDIEGGKDPADAVLKNPARWQAMVQDARESILYFLKKSAGSKNIIDPLAKKKIGEEILPMIGRIRNEIEKAHWIRELSSLLKVSEDALWRELATYKAGAMPERKEDLTQPKESVSLTRKERLEERIAGVLLLEPQFALLGDLPVKADCSSPVAAELFELLQKDEIHGIRERFFIALSGDYKEAASRYMFEAEVFSDPKTREKEFLSLLHSWKELSLKEKLQALSEEIRRLEALGKKEDTSEPLEEFQRLTSRLANITLETRANAKKTKKEN